MQAYGSRHFLLLASCARPSENIWVLPPEEPEDEEDFGGRFGNGSSGGCAERGGRVTPTPATAAPIHFYAVSVSQRSNLTSMKSVAV